MVEVFELTPEQKAVGSNPAGDARKSQVTGLSLTKWLKPSLVFEQIVSKSTFKTPFLGSPKSLF